MNEKDRKAWVRIVEAFLAILIISTALFVLIAKSPAVADIDEEIYEKQRQILNVISKNDALRNDIVNGDNAEVNNTISEMISSSWNFETNICDINSVCPKPESGLELDKQVYSTEVVISSTLTDYIPKKLRFFVWMKS